MIKLVFIRIGICLLALLSEFGCKHSAVTLLAPAAPPVAIAKTPLGKGSPAAVANVRSSESVKVYGVNRYVDPSDPRILHERHAIYRVEQQPAWVTRTRDDRGSVLLGPILGLRRPEYAPEPLAGETTREIAKAKQDLKNNSTDLQTLQQDQRKLAANVQAVAEQTLESQKKLTEIVSVLNERIKQLEASTNRAAPNTQKTGVEAPTDVPNGQD